MAPAMSPSTASAWNAACCCSRIASMPSGPDTFADLTAAHLAPLAAIACDVLLLGTGERLRFPAAAILRPLIEARVGVEMMDTAAACRTYNILVAEGRKAAAALIVEREAA